MIDQSVKHVKIVIKDGFDGAGSQPEIRSKDVKSYFDSGKRLNSLELVGFVPLQLIDVSPDQVGGRINLKHNVTENGRRGVRPKNHQKRILCSLLSFMTFSVLTQIRSFLY